MTVRILSSINVCVTGMRENEKPMRAKYLQKSRTIMANDPMLANQVDALLGIILIFSAVKQIHLLFYPNIHIS